MSIGGIFLFDTSPLRGIVVILPLPVFVLVNVALALGVFYMTKRLKLQLRMKDILNHLSVLGLAWLSFSILFELLFTFDALEASGDTYLFEAFSIGFKNAMILVLGGIVIVCLPVIAYLRTGENRLQPSSKKKGG